jgi:hypothetical protein
MIGQGNGFGVSFMPNGDQRFQRPQDQPGGMSRAPLQEAVKILSMRVPRVVGANPLAPLSLLQGQGAGGLQPGQLEQLMRTLGIGPSMQTGEVPTTGAGPSVGGAPSPFASMQSLMPTASNTPTVSVTAGAREGEGTMPPPAEPPQPAAPTMPSGGGGDDSAALWELARRQREGMGRIAY